MKKWVVEKRYYEGAESYVMEQETFNTLEEAEDTKEFYEQARMNQPNEFYVVYDIDKEDSKCEIVYDYIKGVITYTAKDFKYVDTSNNGKHLGFIKLMKHLGFNLSRKDINKLRNGDFTDIDILDYFLGESGYTAIFID